MHTTSGIWPQDRADFVELLHQALEEREIRDALRADPSGEAAVRLRSRALAAADEIAAAADEEYRVYLAARATSAGRGPATGSTGLLLLAVLAPPVSAAAGVVLLLIGYGAGLWGPVSEFALSARTAGWLLTGFGAVTAISGLLALLVTAVRGQGGRRPGRSGTERARRRWRRALLDRGVLPYLRRHLPDPSLPG
ncbi:hypothetical protein ABZ439_37860 [Streptomyces sp. NPDC005840]|uniref:hypothetical protein n=1 Tax=Streptomyces sp. NPDC005840 TaxID=3157072 RepID=UPI00340CE7CB